MPAVAPSATLPSGPGAKCAFVQVMARTSSVAKQIENNFFIDRSSVEREVYRE
jgi:hypothetical protein